jgi:hypothetical protein
MIPVDKISYQKVSDTAPGSLALFKSDGEWFLCLTVKHKDHASNPDSLLALDFKDGKIGRGPFLFRDMADNNCLVIGKAEFYFPDDFHCFSFNPELGRLMLGSNGAAIIGNFQGDTSRKPERGCWLISTGLRTRIDSSVPFVSSWEVGFTNAGGKFVKMLQVPYQ